MSLSTPSIAPHGSSNSGILATALLDAVPESSRTPLGVLSRYQLYCPLGRGGMAEVHLAAWQVAPEVVRPVVIKRLYDCYRTDPAVVGMFVDEARLVCQLDHENIVKTYEVGLLDGRICIVMEYLDGQTVQQLLRRCWEREGLPAGLAIHIAIKVLAALRFAHQATDQQGRAIETVHRDISPHNVMVTNAGLVKVLDFGIAKARLFEQRTATGMVKGKLAYISPEQACGMPIDGRADIWSLGVVLWEMLAGQRLFRAEGDAATLNATLRREIPLLTEIRPDVPAAVAIAVARALERDPNRRYASAGDMQEDLERCLEHLGVRPDAGALAALMQRVFAEEIPKQRGQVSQLTAQALAPRADDALPHEPTRNSNLAALITNELTAVELVAHKLRQSQRRTALTAAALFAIVTVMGVWLAMREPNELQLRQPISRQSESPQALVTALPQRATGNATPLALPGEPSTAKLEVAPPPSQVTDSMSHPAVTKRPGSRGYRRNTAPRSGVGEAAQAVELRSAEAEPSTRTSEPPASADSGFLTLDTTPWSNVSVDGKPLGMTPLIRVKLATGTHQLSLSNPELALNAKYTVKIATNQNLVKRIGLK